ncbi:MAG: PEP-CTERM sorting domain-containing protein [Acidobacteria bacterium]|nr:PEP-CTERM sorting domain-containing protein [Acidobacteriota bacterium]
MLSNNLARPLFLAACLLISTVGASATTVVFGTGGTAGFTNGGSSDSGMAGGVMLTATPWANGAGPAPVLTVTSGGYGVDSHFLDQQQIDGLTRNEAVVLTFSAPVLLNGYQLTDFVPGFDDVDILVNGSAGGIGSIGTVIAFRADGNIDNFRLRSVDFTAVPEPSSLALAGLGLGLAGLIREHRK